MHFSTGASDILVVAEVQKGKITQSTRATLGAAKKIGGNVTLLLAGDFKGDSALAKQAAKLDGVNKVIVADKPQLDHGLPEM
jgi:electron transfer flavoprotein alpha subunit